MSVSTFGRHHSPASCFGCVSSGSESRPATEVSREVGSEPAVALPVLDAEKLDCYRLAIEFQPVAAAVGRLAGYNLRDQLDRASLSIVTNLSEGAGRRSRREGRRFYQIARGSAAECGALLDVLLVRELALATEVRRAKHYVVRLVQMLSKLDEGLR